MKLLKATHLFALAGVPLLWLCSPCHARGTKPDVRAKGAQVVQVDLGNEAGGWGYEPLDFLAGSLAHHPRSHLFRVTWVLIVGSLSSTITALYDRRGKTVRYYCCGGHNAAGDPADIVYAHYLYTGVTEQVIRQASAFEQSREQGTASRYGRGPYPDAIRKSPKYPKAGTAGNYYDALLTFGSHRRKLP